MALKNFEQFQNFFHFLQRSPQGILHLPLLLEQRAPEAADPALAQRFRELLLGMKYADPELRPLFDLEGLTMWCEGRLDGYLPLEDAVNRLGIRRLSCFSFY